MNFHEIGMVASSSSSSSSVHRRKLKPSSSNSVVELDEDGPGKKMQLKKPLEIYVDGPFGAPSSNIFRAEHAVLIGTGIGVTPFASILQSIMHRYWQVKRQCPQCQYQWSDEISSIFNLKKVCTYIRLLNCSTTYYLNYNCFTQFVGIYPCLNTNQVAHPWEKLGTLAAKCHIKKWCPISMYYPITYPTI